MKHILAVYDVDPVYAARFAEVVNQKEKIPFEVVAFSSIERLRAFAAEHPVKLLLLGEHVPAEEKESIRAETSPRNRAGCASFALKILFH